MNYRSSTERQPIITTFDIFYKKECENNVTNHNNCVTPFLLNNNTFALLMAKILNGAWNESKSPEMNEEWRFIANPHEPIKQ